MAPPDLFRWVGGGRCGAYMSEYLEMLLVKLLMFGDSKQVKKYSHIDQQPS